MPQVPATQSIDPAAADAHLAQLHKMSTTAGVTNVGYVAVNQTAIAAVLLGLASALAFFGWLLLVGGAIVMGAMQIAGVRGDEKAIASTLSQIGSFVRQGKYKEAYALFDS